MILKRPDLGPDAECTLTFRKPNVGDRLLFSTAKNPTEYEFLYVTSTVYVDGQPQDRDQFWKQMDEEVYLEVIDFVNSNIPKRDKKEEAPLD